MHDGTGLTDRPWGGKTADEVVVEGLMSEGMRGVGGQEAVLLAQRGVRDAASARRFYDCPLSTIGSPRGLKGIERAAEEIRRAAASGWSVGVMGDYDVDGVMSAAILGRVCTAAGGTRPRLMRRRKPRICSTLMPAAWPRQTEAAVS